MFLAAGKELDRWWRRVRQFFPNLKPDKGSAVSPEAFHESVQPSFFQPERPGQAAQATRMCLYFQQKLGRCLLIRARWPRTRNP